MRKPTIVRAARAGRQLLPVVASLALAACAGSPAAAPAGAASGDEQVPVDLARTQEQSRDGVTVQVSVPTEAQVSRQLGAAFAEHGIQPIWLRLVNESDVDYWLLPLAIDPDYYSADEVALVAGAKLDKEERAELTGILRANALPLFLKSGSANQGYVFASHMRGGRLIDVLLSGHGRSVSLRFAVLLPTQLFDYARSPLRQLYAQVEEFPDLTVEQLRDRLRELPCCTTNADGSGLGDPLNVVLVGSSRDVLAALTAGGWTFTEAITVDSVRRMVGAAIAEKSMLTAPVSALYALGRKQDMALQRGRSNINQRNHMRLWLAPFRCEGRPVWVGQVSRDIGVKVTPKSPTFTTHIIDPVVDESREYLLQSLLFHEAVARFAFVQGVGAATVDAPRHNLTDDPYITDGLRLVLWVSSTEVASHAAENLQWNESTDPILHGKGEYATVPRSGD